MKDHSSCAAGARHGTGNPSAWAQRWSREIAGGGTVLDLACGGGRHTRMLAAAGFRVLAVDRDREALAGIAGVAGVTTQHADLETGEWRLAGRRFDGILVTNYLHRPLFPDLLDALVPGGVLIYETFAAGNERFGKPSNPAFLLRRGELLEVVRGRLHVIAFEDIEVAQPAPACVQRICARAFASEV